MEYNEELFEACKLFRHIKQTYNRFKIIKTEHHDLLDNLIKTYNETMESNSTIQEINKILVIALIDSFKQLRSRSMVTLNFSFWLGDKHINVSGNLFTALDDGLKNIFKIEPPRDIDKISLEYFVQQSPKLYITDAIADTKQYKKLT